MPQCNGSNNRHRFAEWPYRITNTPHSNTEFINRIRMTNVVECDDRPMTTYSIAQSSGVSEYAAAVCVCAFVSERVCQLMYGSGQCERRRQRLFIAVYCSRSPQGPYHTQSGTCVWHMGKCMQYNIICYCFDCRC